MLLAMKDEAESTLKDEKNYFMLDNSYEDETLEELTTTLIMMARIQPADDNAVTEPTCDAKDVSEDFISKTIHVCIVIIRYKKSALNQQTLADSGANERPIMLEKGNYIPWESRFRRFSDKKLEEGERMWHSIKKGPYVRPMIPDPDSDDNAVTEPTYDANDVSEVNASHKVHEQENHGKRKIIIHTSDHDQIDSNIIFYDPYVENNGGTSEHDSNAIDQYHDIQILAYNISKQVETLSKQAETISFLTRKDMWDLQARMVKSEETNRKHADDIAKIRAKERQRDMWDLQERMVKSEETNHQHADDIEKIRAKERQQVFTIREQAKAISKQAEAISKQADTLSKQAKMISFLTRKDMWDLQARMVKSEETNRQHADDIKNIRAKERQQVFTIREQAEVISKQAETLSKQAEMISFLTRKDIWDLQARMVKSEETNREHADDIEKIRAKERQQVFTIREQAISKQADTLSKQAEKR
nr:hypothetical protein [Tanacetum cinerariifolium]